MKRLIAAAVLFVFIVVCFFSGHGYIKNVCKNADSLLTDCKNAFETDADAAEQSEKLMRYWSEKENTLSIFTNHSAIDEIELAIEELKVYSSATESKYFYERFSKVKTLIHQMLEDAKPSMHSVL